MRRYAVFVVLSALVLVCSAAFCLEQEAKAASTSASATIAITPSRVALVPGDKQQFATMVTGAVPQSADAILWSVNDVAGGDATVGTISKTGLYVTPYPAPATVTVKATLASDKTKAASAVITISAAPVAEGPRLSVNVAAQTHPISPLIYGVNNYGIDPTILKAARITANRWGGNATTRYNYKLDVTNMGNDWFFEVFPNKNTAYPEVSEFNSEVQNDRAGGAITVGTVPVIGWVTKSRTQGSSFSVKKYGAQQKIDPYWPDFGNGIKPEGTPITDNDPTDTCMRVDETWAGEWVSYLVKKFGNAASGGVAMYSLDNEPTWWDMNHRDVHPLPFTYDEVTENGLKVAKAVKAADPTAAVTGPVIDFWPTYFYSMKDVRAAWKSGLAGFVPTDRKTHGDLPLIDYYLRQFKAAQDADPKHTRYLDYLDLHTYFAAEDAGLKPAGATDKQAAVLNSTRVFWDATYKSAQFVDPDDPGPAFNNPAAPEIIRRMKRWVDANYPGTKTAITEYNWGGQEHISGAVAQADILGIFGREGLDLGMLWGPPDPKKQVPGLNAFKIYRNYDNAGGEFGNLSVTATSGDQGSLAIYAALREADKALTVMVINKTFGDLKTDVSLEDFKAAGPVRVFQYSNADLNSIRALPDIKLSAPAKGSKPSVIREQTFPAMSMTLLVVKKK